MSSETLTGRQSYAWAVPRGWTLPSSTVAAVDPMPEPGDVIAAFSPLPGRCFRMVLGHQLQADHRRGEPAWKGIHVDAKGKSWYV